MFPKLFPYQMGLVLFNSNTTGVTIGAETANPSEIPQVTPGF